jgi:type VI secretion system protein ImpF
MPELTPHQCLQPALLDRLTDERPDEASEPPRARVIDTQRLRSAVLRDLAWLLNTTAWRRCEAEGLGDEARRSVLNYGVACIAGQVASTIDLREVEASIRRSILAFEPRIDPSSLVVEALARPAATDRRNVVPVCIRGLLWAHPVPLELLLRTDLDLETGEVRIREASGAAFT